MFPEANCLTPPGRLLEYLDDNSALGLRYRQRAVLTKHADDTWHVVCSAMQSFSPAIGIPTGKASFWYERAGFFECWYDAAQCRQFIDEVQRGKLQFDKVSIARNVGANWQSEIFSANNMYMSDAGLVAHTRFETVGASMNVDALMAKGRPYYSNAEDAAREWLPFADYHGHGDGRNGEVLFLLPQFRAHFTSVCWTAGALKICVSGSDVGRDLTLLVKGNYRIGRSTAHFERAVKAGQVSVEVAQDAQRAEYYLTNARETIFDAHTSDRQPADRKQWQDMDSSAIPAADRVVALDHNSMGYKDALEGIELLIVKVEAANDFGDENDKRQNLAELRAGKSLLEGVRAHAHLIWLVISPALLWLADKCADGVIGDLAVSTLYSVGRLLGL